LTIIPGLAVVERCCAEVVTRAQRRLYKRLTAPLSEDQKKKLETLLNVRQGTHQTLLAWLRQPAGAPSARNLLDHVAKLQALRQVGLPADIGRTVHQNHLLRLAREGAQTVDGILKVTPLANAVPEESEALMRQVYALLPHVKVTDLLLEVDRWTRFTDDFTHLKSQEPAKDQPLLLTVILADAINLGLHKMAEACPGTSIAKLSWLSAWHIRDETYSKALARLVNHQHRQSFAAHWGEGTTSSSDEQQFRAGGRGEQAGQVNLRYGTEPGVLFYTHVSDQYAPFHTKVINATVRDATQVLDGLLYHESDLKIEEHYTDTAGFTDHVFALCH
jgi:hypothetical protein